MTLLLSHCAINDILYHNRIAKVLANTQTD